jgi:eukaryotic-like serine/threonine-protein kinase
MKCTQCHFDNTEDSFFCKKCGTKLPLSDEVLYFQTKTIQAHPLLFDQGNPVAGKYRIIAEIGSGGMGVVYKAEDTKLRRTVALKFLPPELSRHPEAIERFVREAHAAAVLDHPHICTIFEVGEYEDTAFIAMAYIEGQSLREKTAKQPLGIDEALDIAIQVAEGLEEAHNKGIIHRDIKSANIMVTEKGQAKIMDFGLAKVVGESLITKEAKTMGTVAYMSPEQARGEVVDQRTDIWSLGVVLYEMLSGQLPFQGERETSIMYSIVHEEPKPLKAIRPDVPAELERIIKRALEKRPDLRYPSAGEMLRELKNCRKSLEAAELGVLNLRSLWRRIRKPQVAIPAVIIIVALVFLGLRFSSHQAKVRWARQVALPEIEKLIEGNDCWRNLIPVYKLAEKAEKIIPRDPKLAELFSKCSFKINIRINPPGAKIYMKEYMAPDSEWTYLGVSPIEQIRLPVGIFRWKIEKEGYETVLAAASTWGPGLSKHDVLGPNDLMRMMDKKGSIPLDMVRVSGADTAVGKLDDFFIDAYEVTNKQYKEFVNGGGYRNKKYWKQKFIKDGRNLPWEEAVKEFVDQTGQSGPSTWQAGDYPEGQGDYPVSGISWYEAAAYAEFAGKSLPTGEHWGIARGEYTTIIQVPQLGGFAILAPFSNFRGKGPVPVGSLPGITSYGAFDMAGNVREWCWNEASKGRLIRGGAWDDNPYIFGNLSQAPPMERSPLNGFRCAFYPNPDKIPGSAFQAVKPAEAKDLYKEKPVPDPIFQVYKEQFSYDKTDLKARVESRQENPGGWIQEKVSFDAAYGGERVIAYLFLPKNAKPPFQTVIYFPGSASIDQRSSQDIESYYEFPMFLSFIVKNGRAALYPVYKGTFERGNDTLTALIYSNDLNSHQYVDLFVQDVKDFRRCVDFLETRPDIDSQKIAYYGMSWGAGLGAYIPAVEERLKASILLGGCINGLGRPEINDTNFVGRVKIPTLMLNGKYDTLNPVETAIKPMFDLLGTPADRKRLILYETDHIPPVNEFIKETLAWLDRYLGPVK